MSNIFKITVGEMCRTKAGTLAFAALVGTSVFVGSEFGRILNGEKTKIETAFDYAKNEYNTYREIKKEGIKADSYAEAKQKLDSIKTCRLYEKYGIECPDENTSAAEKLNRQLELQIKMNEENRSNLQQLLETIKTIDKNY